MRWKRALCTSYERLVRFAERAHRMHGTQRARLVGERELLWPAIAFRAGQESGPVRHALAQRTVAGTHIAPFGFAYPWPQPQASRPAPGGWEGLVALTAQGADEVSIDI